MRYKRNGIFLLTIITIVFNDINNTLLDRYRFRRASLSLFLDEK